jgi:predicted ArsR family transcriptional regulator
VGRVAIEDTGATSGAALLVSPVRRAIMDALANHRPVGKGKSSPVHGMTAAQLASVLDLHVTTVRFHLDQLVAAGLVSAEFTKVFGVGRPRKVYHPAPGSLDGARTDAGHRALTELLAEALGEQLTPGQAGRRWARHHVPRDDARVADTPGRWLTKIARMIDALHDWGYTPDLATSEGGRTCTIDLVRCPFLELASTHPAVVCGIHRGLIQGAMEQLGEADTEVSLEPFVEPHLCRAQIRTRTPFRARTVVSEES